MQHLLILSASVGAGHMRAAQAIELAARELYPQADIRNVDVLSLTNAPFRRLYGKAYLDLVNKAPHVLGYFYDLMDKQPKLRQSDQLMHLVQKANLTKLTDLLTGDPWDLVICTHFLPAEILASLKQKRKVTYPHVTVTTDFETHRLWVNQPCDHYFTATEEGARYLESFGVPADKVSTAGIPIHPAFARLPARKQCLQRHGLSGDRPILLQLAGGFGVGPIQKVHQAILELSTPVELITVCGRNEQCARELEKLACPSHHKRHILGFTDVIHELMAVADLVISKPGGLTSSELLAAGAAMVIINPIPGQESRNADYLLEQGAAIKANNLPTLSFKLEQLLAEPQRLSRMKARAKATGRPRAAYDILQAAAKLPERRQTQRGRIDGCRSWGY